MRASPPRSRCRGKATKIVLRSAARGLVPDEIIDKPKIGFFVDTAGEWLRTRLATQAMEGTVGPGLVAAGLIDEAALRELVSSFVEQRAGAPRARLLLALVMLETWMETFLPRAFARAATLP